MQWCLYYLGVFRSRIVPRLQKKYVNDISFY